mgnify:CR=1 FL=1
MSRVVVNEIEAKVGNDITFNDAAKIDTLKGKTTAGSITVQGEGNATTNLQQGLAKSWIFYEMDASTPVAADSLNHSTITDNNNGCHTVTMTSPMASINYCTTSGCGVGQSGVAYAIVQMQMDQTAGEAPNTTTTYTFLGVAYNASTLLDFSTLSIEVVGDLA